MSNRADNARTVPPAERTLLEGIVHYLSVLLRYRWMIILSTVVVAIGAVAFSIASLRLPLEINPLPNRYTATAVVLVQRAMGDTLSASILSALGVATESNLQGATSGFDIGALLIRILESRTLIDRIVEDFRVTEKHATADRARTAAREWILGRSSFDYSSATATLTISFEDTDPVFARDVTNRMVELLNDWYAQNMSSTNVRQRQLLEEKVREVKAGIDTLESRLKELQKKYGVLTAQDLGTSQASTLAELRSQLILKEIEIKNYSTVSAIEDPKLQQLRKERQNILDLINQAQKGVPSLQEEGAAATSLPDVQMQFNNLTVELDVQRSIYNTLSQQYEVSKLTSEPERALQVLELAEIPDTKSGPHRSQIVIIATLLGFAASAALALLLNAFAQIKRQPQGKASAALRGQT